MKQHVFIIGSKGIPAHYGGFETFVDKLTYYKKNDEIIYHVSCLVEPEEWLESKEIFEHNKAECFAIKALRIGSAKAIFYDLFALKYCLEYIQRKKIEHAVIYVLACRIGPFIGYYKKKIQELGGHLYVNPDGHEWKRSKWSYPVKMYWKWSERLMVKHAELLICDSKNIQKYIRRRYKKYCPKTIYIAYGSEVKRSLLALKDDKVVAWYQKKKVRPGNYYLIVGRFVPENNFETMIEEFMKTHTDKELVLITGAEKTQFYEVLRRKTHYEKDSRIKFVGTVYDEELLKKIRENAYAYLHGHEVGGTNPSLLEALGSTDVNMLFDVSFNREVGEDSALYWNKKEGNLAGLIDQVDGMSKESRHELGEKARKRVEDWYSWDYIVNQYEKIFVEG